MEMAEKPNRGKILFQIGDLQLNLMNMKIWVSVRFAAENDKCWVSNGRGKAITDRHSSKEKRRLCVNETNLSRLVVKLRKLDGVIFILYYSRYKIFYMRWTNNVFAQIVLNTERRVKSDRLIMQGRFQ